MNSWLTDQVVGGLILGNASAGEQQMAYKGIEELEAQITQLKEQVESLKGDSERLRKALAQARVMCAAYQSDLKHDFMAADPMSEGHINNKLSLASQYLNAIDTALKGDAVKG